MRFSYVLAAVVLLALASSVSSSASRSLFQACPIWRCASGCQLEDQLTGGVRRWTCAACLPTYRLSSNKRACVCPSGTYETNGNCTRCPQGSYCPVGNGNGPSTSVSVGTAVQPVTESISSGMRSYRITCGSNMTTRLSGARDEVACVTVAGNSYGGPGINATTCPINTYNPGLNRLTACYACPSGLITVATGSVSKLDCLVPAGFIMNRGVVQACPKGTFRADNALPTAQLNCTRCNRGWTTTGVASTQASNCNFTLPGFQSTADTQLAGNTVACPKGTYSTGAAAPNACPVCLEGYTTKPNGVDSDGLEIGATSQSACSAPPGYYTNGATLIKCPFGTYASGWARRKDTTLSGLGACTICGTGITSEYLSPDEHLTGNVSASSDNCVMAAGWGMTFNRTSGSFTAAICPANTYGALEKTYGLKFSPCRPCARNLVSGAGSISKDNCTNTAGWGWNGFTAEICPAGSYAAAGTLTTCTTCPMYRNTTSIAVAPFFTDLMSAMPVPATTGTDMDAITDCKVIAGYGVLNTSALTGMTDAAKVALDIEECAVGTYSTGGAIDSLCTACSGAATGTFGAYSTTAETGSTGPTSCNLCIAGYGTGTNSISASATTCSGCMSGFYQIGGNTTCVSCGANAEFVYPGKLDTVTIPPVSKPGTGTTPGARSTEECYPGVYQMDESMGTHLVDTTGFIANGSIPAGAVAASAVTAQACATNCNNEPTCVGSTFIYTNTSSAAPSVTGGSCFEYRISPVGGMTLYVKALPLDFMAGASSEVRAQAAVASGAYAVYATAPPNLGDTISNTTATTLDACKSSCNNDSRCVLFYYNGFCVIKKGFEGEGHRTFMHNNEANIS